MSAGSGLGSHSRPAVARPDTASSRLSAIVGSLLPSAQLAIRLLTRTRGSCTH